MPEISGCSGDVHGRRSLPEGVVAASLCPSKLRMKIQDPRIGWWRRSGVACFLKPPSWSSRQVAFGWCCGERPRALLVPGAASRRFLRRALPIEPVGSLADSGGDDPFWWCSLGWCSWSRRCAACVGVPVLSVSSGPTPRPALPVLSLFGVARLWCFTCNLVGSSVFCVCAVLCCKLGSAPCNLSP